MSNVIDITSKLKQTKDHTPEIYKSLMAIELTLKYLSAIKHFPEVEIMYKNLLRYTYYLVKNRTDLLDDKNKK